MVLTPAPGVSAAPVPEAPADEVVLAPAEEGTTATVEEVLEPEPVELELGLALACVETTVEEEAADVPEVRADVPEVVPAGTDDEVEEEPDSGAGVADAPVPVEVRTASRRLPLLPAATQVPATLLEIS